MEKIDRADHYGLCSRPMLRGLREMSGDTATRAKLRPKRNTTGVPDGKETVIMNLPITLRK